MQGTFFLCFSSKQNYSPGEIAPVGQTSAQVPQSTQVAGSIEYFAPSEIAPLGHSSMQVPQAMQSSLITYAILFIFLGLINIFVTAKIVKGERRGKKNQRIFNLTCPNLSYLSQG